jgi:hypothetical protein
MQAAAVVHVLAVWKYRTTAEMRDVAHALTLIMKHQIVPQQHKLCCDCARLAQSWAWPNMLCCAVLCLQARDMVMMAVRSHFRPEFINRIDEFIMFDPLEQEQIKSIVRLQVCDACWRVSIGTLAT